MTDTASFLFGIHHFCDHRCWRCPLAARCRVNSRCREMRVPASIRAQPAARVAFSVKAAMEVTLEELTEMAKHHGATLDPVPADATFEEDCAAATALNRAVAESPLGLAATEYAESSRTALRALAGLRSGRDREEADACERLEEMCFSVCSKIIRALSSAAGRGRDLSDPQSDAHGSAKVALLLIEESRQAWRVLMRRGRACANGAPARFVAMLDGLEAGVLRSFPRALEFVRPGFDTGELDGAARDIARALLTGTGRSAAPN